MHNFWRAVAHDSDRRGRCAEIDADGGAGRDAGHLAGFACRAVRAHGERDTNRQGLYESCLSLGDMTCVNMQPK